jgi:nucleoside-triphosphatase
LKKRILLLMGSPGIGKTTIMLKTAESLKARGLTVGGMISREVRSGDSRMGFEILDLNTGRTGWLAHVNQENGPKVGKYRVNISELDDIGVGAIMYAILNSDVIMIDEVGPMEISSERFKEAVRRAVASPKPVVAVVHWKAHDSVITKTMEREDVELYPVSYGNREHLDGELLKKILDLFSTTLEK